MRLGIFRKALFDPLNEVWRRLDRLVLKTIKLLLQRRLHPRRRANTT
jgi:hypothetical protein